MVTMISVRWLCHGLGWRVLNFCDLDKVDLGWSVKIAAEPELDAYSNRLMMW